jgi:hypothetical protein
MKPQDSQIQRCRVVVVLMPPRVPAVDRLTPSRLTREARCARRCPTRRPQPTAPMRRFACTVDGSSDGR